MVFFVTIIFREIQEYANDNNIYLIMSTYSSKQFLIEHLRKEIFDI